MDSFGIWQFVRLGRNDRGTLIGKTGSGKTTLARFLLEDYHKPYSVTWNPKNSDAVNSWYHKQYYTLDELFEAKEQRLIYTPHYSKAEDEADQEKFFYWIYERKYTRVYVDEATSVVGGTSPPRFLTAIVNRGRERGISSLIATQRPKRVPLNILSEAEHFYIFKLLLLDDRKRVEEICGITVEQQAQLNDYEFFYFNISRGLFPHKLKLDLRQVYG